MRRDKKNKRVRQRIGEHERERESVGERFYRSDYFEETAVIHTPCEQLMSVIHQQGAVIGHLRGNIMLTALSF